MAIGLLLFVGACTTAPEPGNLSLFCSLLEQGTGLTSAPTAEDLEDLARTAPPEIRPTIEALQSRGRDFDDLLAEDPPDLEAIFNARFDRDAQIERAALDEYAENSCGLEVNRPPGTRWNTWVRQNHGEAAWRQAVAVQFELVGEQISSMTMVFDAAPEPVDQIEQACDAARDFLQGENAEPGSVQVIIGTVRVLDLATSSDECRLP